MDYALAIRRNREQLKAIVLALFALAGALTSPRRGEVSPQATERGFAWFLPRSTIAMIMAVLRPAESAVRRLIVIVAAGLKPMTMVHSGADIARLADLHPWGEMSRLAVTEGGSVAKFRTFPLFDPLKSFDPDAIWDSEPVFESGYSLTKSISWHDATTDHTPTDATHLGLRLNAILRALNDLPRQARRLKRWELKRNQRLAAHKPVRFSPMRPGLPPGWRERRIHEVDYVLKECHGLAQDRLSEP